MTTPRFTPGQRVRIADDAGDRENATKGAYGTVLGFDRDEPFLLTVLQDNGKRTHMFETRFEAAAESVFLYGDRVKVVGWDKERPFWDGPALVVEGNAESDGDGLVSIIPTGSQPAARGGGLTGMTNAPLRGAFLPQYLRHV